MLPGGGQDYGQCFRGVMKNAKKEQGVKFTTNGSGQLKAAMTVSYSYAQESRTAKEQP